MENLIHLWHEFLGLTEFIPIDLILVVAIAFMFGRFVWVMQHRTRIWDNLSRSLMAVFVSICLVFGYLALTWVTDPFQGQEVILWTIRVGVLVSITWSQFELNKELKKVPNILFVRDRNWVRRRIRNVETIRALLKSYESTPPELLEAIDAELEEMYRFKQVVWEEDKKHGYEKEPEWMQSAYYMERHGLSITNAESGGISSAFEHDPTPTPGDAYPGEGGNR